MTIVGFKNSTFKLFRKRWILSSDYIISVLKWHIIIIVIVAHGPTNFVDEDTVELFYKKLSNFIHSVLLLMLF